MEQNSNKNLITLLLGISLLCFSACHKISVTVDSNSSKSVSEYDTFQIAENKQKNLNDERIKSLLDKTLSDFGYKQATDEGSKLLIKYSIDQERILLVGGRKIKLYELKSSSSRGKREQITRGANHREYEITRLVIDAIDAPSGEVIWRGSSESKIDGDSSPDSKRNLLKKSIEKVLDRFPERKS